MPHARCVDSLRAVVRCLGRSAQSCGDSMRKTVRTVRALVKTPTASPAMLLDLAAASAQQMACSNLQMTDVLQHCTGITLHAKHLCDGGACVV